MMLGLVGVVGEGTSAPLRLSITGLIINDHGSGPDLRLFFFKISEVLIRHASFADS